MNSDLPPDLVLASGSAYRRELLARLGLPFSVSPPDCDETPEPGEAAASHARRLADVKAGSVAQRHPRAVVIGSDQAAALGSNILGKPGTFERAREQLKSVSGRSVTFHTAVTVVCEARGFRQSHEDITTVRFTLLDDGMIDRYLNSEDVLQCAGSFKSEGKGIVLFESIVSHDPTALIGLPMIWLSGILRRIGFTLP